VNRVLQVLLTGNATNLKGVLTSASQSVEAFERRVQGSNQRVAQGASLATNGLKALALGGAALAVGYGLAVGKAMEFDKAMSAAASATQTAGAELGTLRDAAMKAGADSQYSATEAAGAITEMGKAGVSSADILGGGLKGALDLAAAGQLDVAEAAGISSVAMTQFNLTGKDLPHVADLLAAGAGKAMGSVGDLGAALGQAGLLASSAGMNIEETTGTLAAFASAGLTGSDAGTSLKTMLQMLQAPTQKSSELMSQLGLDVYDANGDMLGMDEIAGQLQSTMGGMTDEQRNAAMAVIFGADAVRAANVLYKEGQSGIAGWTTAVDDQGFAAKTAAELTNNLAGDLERMGGSFETLLIQIGSGAQGPLRLMAQGLTGILDAAGEAIAGLGEMDSANSLLDSTGAVLQNVWSILMTIADAVMPVVGGLASIGGSVIVGGLTVLAQALESTTGFLADNQEMAAGLAAVLAVQLMGGLAGVQRLLWTMVGTPAVLFFSNVLTAVGSLAGVMSGGFVAAAGAARTALVGLLTTAAPFIAVAAIGAAVYSILQADSAAKDARTSIEKLLAPVNEADTNVERIDAQKVAIEGLRGEAGTAQAELEAYESRSTLQKIWDFGDTDDPAAALKQAVADTSEALTKQEEAAARAEATIQALGGRYGITRDQVIAFADANGINLSGSLDKTQYQFGLVASQTGAFSGQLGVLPGAIDAATGSLALIGDATDMTETQIVEATEAIAKWREELMKVGASFVEPLAVYKGLLDEKTAKERESAQATVDARNEEVDKEIEALRRRTDAEIAAVDTSTAEGQALRDQMLITRDDTIAKMNDGKVAYEDFATETSISLDEVAAKLEEQIRNQENWRTNLVIVAQKAGFEVASQLAMMGQEGVELTAAMANGTSAETQRMADAMIEDARLGGEGAAAQLDTQMRIMAAIGAQQGRATAEGIARELGIGVDVVAAVAADYGVALAKGVNPVLSGVGKAPISIGNGQYRTSGGAIMMADGGMVGSGESHVAQIAPAGAWRVWAEEETGGEAYIPLAASKRRRSLDIWKETGKRLGQPVEQFYSGALVTFGRRLQGMGARVAEHPAFPPLSMTGHGTNSKHYTGDAIDVNTRAGTSALEQRELAPMAALARSAGFRTIFMAPDHYNHLHVDSGSGGASIGSANAAIAVAPRLPMPPSLAPRFGFPITNAGDAAMMHAHDAAQAYVDSLVSTMTEPSPGVGGGGGTGPVRAQVQAAAARFGWQGDPQWAAIDRLIQKESSWNPNAQNPTSTAYGLFQFLNSTWGSVGGTKTSNPGLQAQYGLQYVKNRYGTPTSALAFHNRNNWYDDGGLASGTGHMLKNTIQPERVLSGRQTEAFEAWMSSPAAQRGYASAGPGVQPSAAMDYARLAAAIAEGRPVDVHLNVRDNETANQVVTKLVQVLRVKDRGGVYSGARI